jgi:hypothetical protein
MCRLSIAVSFFLLFFFYFFFFFFTNSYLTWILKMNRVKLQALVTVHDTHFQASQFLTETIQ